MKTIRLFLSCVAAVVALLTALALPRTADAQTTNWIAFNDHRPFTTPLTPPSWGFTAPNVTGYNMGAPGDTAASPLTDFRTGNPLAATVAFTRTLAPDDFGAVGRPVPTNTPAGRLFYGICDVINDGIVGVDRVDGDIVTITFANLDPTKFYIFRGTAIRNGGYAARWSVVTIAANGWSDAHINGATGPGVLTANNFPAANLTPGQAAYNSGNNPEGAVVGWDFISPGLDGTFTIVQEQYVGPTPGGGQATDANYGYAFSAMMLAEVEVSTPVITANPPASTTVEQNRPFSLSVAATGAPLNYQWYKAGVEIPGATFPTYSVAQAAAGDSALYYAVVYNALARRTSTVAQVTVFPDTAAPTVESIFSYPTVDAGGVATLNQIIIEFSEPVTPASVSSPASYTVAGAGNPASVIVTNGRSVVLMLSFPMSEDTDYSVTLSGATDAVGNVAGSSSAPFHSWVAGGGNGLLMESYPVEDTSILPESVLTDPDYPNNPDRRDSLRAFDTRLVYPDESREQYGARIRGVFIPPVSGDWRFFARMPVLGVLYLNPNGTAESGKVEIVRQSTQNAPYPWDRLQSSAVSLRAGRAYYIEGLYKNATGPDYFKVAARLGGTGVPTPVDSPDTDAPDANSLAGAVIAYPLAPRDLGGTLSIAQNVGDVTVEDNHDATFSVVVNNPSGLPLFYQWSREGSGPIAGANGPSYTFQASLDTDDNAMFSVTVSKIGSADVTSRTARLTVVPDTSGPEVLEVSSPGFTTIIVRFDERVDSFTAQDAFSYGLIGPAGAIGVSLAILEADGRTVTLTPVETLVDGAVYTLEVEGVTDLAGRAIEPNPTLVTFTAGIPRPQLAIERYDTQVTLSWPVSAGAFVLEQANALANPSSATVWTAVGVTPDVIGGRNNVSVNAGPGNKLFRLRQ